MKDGKLTGKQRQVMALVAQGLTNEEIAEVLGLSKRTIDAHLRNGMKNLGAPNRAAAVVLALHHQEISLAQIVQVIRSGD